jgi:hypothetical protein
LLLSTFILYLTGQAAHDELPSIYVDLWENNLYVMNGNKVVETFTISSGTDKKQTPIGEFKVIYKAKNWGGGFGTRWLGLNVPWGTFGLHGTNKPWLVGEKVSGGCIRMQNSDVEKLYDLIPLETPVHIDGPNKETSLMDYKIFRVFNRLYLFPLADIQIYS